MPDTHRYTLPSPGGDAAELLAAELWAAGALGVWDRGTDLVAWFPARDVDTPPGGAWELEADRDWQAEWKATISPVAAGRFVIVPTWLADDHAPSADERTIVLDPGRAFGSGHHATTTQCLELLEAVADERGGDLGGTRVLDVGTGTGILAIGAVLLGADEVIAVDVDPDAVEVTAENAARNDAALDARVGSADVDERTYDVVLANLVTDTVVALAPQLIARIRPGGWLIASGIADERRRRAVDALTAAGLDTPTTVSRNGWTALRGRRPEDAA